MINFARKGNLTVICAQSCGHIDPMKSPNSSSPLLTCVYHCWCEKIFTPFSHLSWYYVEKGVILVCFFHTKNHTIITPFLEMVLMLKSRVELTVKKLLIFYGHWTLGMIYRYKTCISVCKGKWGIFSQCQTLEWLI